MSSVLCCLFGRRRVLCCVSVTAGGSDRVDASYGFPLLVLLISSMWHIRTFNMCGRQTDEEREREREREREKEALEGSESLKRAPEQSSETTAWRAKAFAVWPCSSVVR